MVKIWVIWISRTFFVRHLTIFFSNSGVQQNVKVMSFEKEMIYF